MKKLIALLLALVMVFAMAACGAKTEEPAADAPAADAPAADAPADAPAADAPAEEPAPEVPAEPVALGKIAVLNTAANELDYTEDAEAMFNAYWMAGYPVAQYVADNFWFEPADDTAVAQISYQDGYAYEITYAEFAPQILSIDIPEEIAENYEMVTCGVGSAMDMFPYHVGYITVGPEAILFMNKDGYVAQYLFEDIGMVAAEEYDFVCADGFSETIHKDDLAEVEVFYNEESGTIDATSIAYAGYTLGNIAYIIPAGLEEGAEAPAEGVTKINVFENSVGVMGVEPTAEGSFGGSYFDSFSVADMLAFFEMEDATEVTSVSYVAENESMTEDFALFAQKYITLDPSKERQPHTLGKAQAKGEYVKNVAYYLMDNGNAIMYVPETYVEDAGMALTDILAATGMEAATAVDIVCADGYTERIEAANFAEVTLFHTSDRVDATSIANPDYTLMNALYIIPVG